MVDNVDVGNLPYYCGCGKLFPLFLWQNDLQWQADGFSWHFCLADIGGSESQIPSDIAVIRYG